MFRLYYHLPGPQIVLSFSSKQVVVVFGRVQQNIIDNFVFTALLIIRYYSFTIFFFLLQGYKHQRAFIIAQGPLQSTVRNFWKMIYDRKSAVIVMLSDLVERGKEASSQYWPSSGTYQYGEYTVELMGEEPLEGFIIRDLSVTDNKVHQVERDRD